MFGLVQGSVIFSLFLGAPTWAFDPFLILSAAKEVGQFVDSQSEFVEDLEAMEDLYEEGGGEFGEEGHALLSQIREIREIAHDLGYAKEDLESLQLGSSGVQNFSESLSGLTRALRQGKKIHALFRSLQRRAQSAQVESLAVEKNQLKVLHQQLALAYRHDLEDVKKKLQKQKDQKDQILDLQREEKKAGAKTFGKLGILSFPKGELFIEEAIRVSHSTQPFLMALLGLLFFIRLIAIQLTLTGKEDLFHLFKDTLLCAFLLGVAPQLIRGILHLTDVFSNSWGKTQLSEIQPEIPKFFKGSLASFFHSFETVLFWSWIYEWIKYLFFTLAQFITQLGIPFFILLFPLVIFGSQMMKFSVSWTSFLGNFIFLGLWPFFWNLTGHFAATLWGNPSLTHFSDYVSRFLISALQFFSPFLGIKLLQGQSLTRSLSQGVTASLGAAGVLRTLAKAGGGWTARQGQGWVQGALGLTGKGQGVLGRTLAYPLNQGIHRSANAFRRAQADRQSQVQSPSAENPLHPGKTFSWVAEAGKGFFMNDPKASGWGTFLRGFQSKPLHPAQERKK